MFGGCCLAPEPCCVTGDTRCCEQALQICYFEDDDCIAGINSRKSEGEHTSWTDDQYEMMATLRAENAALRTDLNLLPRPHPGAQPSSSHEPWTFDNQ